MLPPVRYVVKVALFQLWARSQEIDEDDEGDDAEAGKQLDNNTKANTGVPTIAEEDEDEEMGEGSDSDANQSPLGKQKASDVIEGKDAEENEKEESEFGKWFWENRGDNNRAWKKRRRDGLKTKRLKENRKITSGRRE